MPMVCVQYEGINICVYIIFTLVICNSDFCANGGTCEVSLVGLTCRLVENSYNYDNKYVIRT